MSVNSISSYNPLTSIYGIDQTGSSQVTSNISPTTSDQSSPDQAKISPMAQMMGQLMQLQTSDPAQFKAVTQKISDDLATQAQTVTDPAESTKLSDLSAKFAQVAQIGNMSSLMPQGATSGGKVSRGGGGSGAGATVSQDISSALSNAAINSNASISVSSNATISSNAGVFGAGDGPDSMRRDMRELRELEKTNPAEFKKVTQKISDDLAAQAQNATDPMQKKMLSDMSAKFESASTSGNMTSLKRADLPSAPSAFGLSSNATGVENGLLSDQQQLMQSFFEQIQNMAANNLASFTSLGANPANAPTASPSTS